MMGLFSCFGGGANKYDVRIVPSNDENDVDLGGSWGMGDDEASGPSLQDELVALCGNLDIDMTPMADMYLGGGHNGDKLGKMVLSADIRYTVPSLSSAQVRADSTQDSAFALIAVLRQRLDQKDRHTGPMDLLKLYQAVFDVRQLLHTYPHPDEEQQRDNGHDMHRHGSDRWLLEEGSGKLAADADDAFTVTGAGTGASTGTGTGTGTSSRAPIAATTMMASVDMLMSAVLDYTTSTIITTARSSSSSGRGGGGVASFSAASCEVLCAHVNALMTASLRLRTHVEFRSVIEHHRQPTQMNVVLTPIPHVPYLPALSHACLCSSLSLTPTPLRTSALTAF